VTHINSPKSCLKSFSHLGDSVTSLGSYFCGFTFFCAVLPQTVRGWLADSSRLADSPLGVGRPFCGPFRQRCCFSVGGDFCTVDHPCPVHQTVHPFSGGQSGAARRTVRSVRSFLPSLIGSFASSLVLSHVLWGIVPRTCSWSITTLSWRLVFVCDFWSCDWM
jgi:hypothetical protein